MKAFPICLMSILIFGVIHQAYGSAYTLRGESAEYVKELQKYAKDLADLCQYAETKFEKKYCFREATSLSKDVWFSSISKQIKDQIFEIKNKYKDEFKPKKTKS